MKEEESTSKLRVWTSVKREPAREMREDSEHGRRRWKEYQETVLNGFRRVSYIDWDVVSGVWRPEDLLKFSQRRDAQVSERETYLAKQLGAEQQYRDALLGELESLYIFIASLVEEK